MLKKYNNDLEIGIDEAGRGPLCGRVYAGAVIWSIDPTKENDKEYKLIKDSKKLTEKRRKVALSWITQNVKMWSYGYAEPEEIDVLNILEATKLAMSRAIDNLKSKYNIEPKYLIIDGCGWENKFPEYNVTSIVKGDDKFLSIAAASIIAKEYHDTHIQQLCLDNPELNERYDLLNNKGYGTKKHLEGLEKYGSSNIHRKTFGRVKQDE